MVAVVSVVIGTVAVLIFRVLVAVALLNDAIVPELVRLTRPPVLFVMPAIVPDPFRLIVPVFVKFASTVEIAPAPVTPIVPALVTVAIEHAPPMFTVFVAAFVRVPVPANAVLAVNVPLFVSVTPVTVRLVPNVNTALLAYAPVKVAVGIEIAFAPEMVFVAPLKLCAPVLAV